jgi:hypothetical protein
MITTTRRRRTILTASTLAAVGILTIAAILPALFPTQEEESKAECLTFICFTLYV